MSSRFHRARQRRAERAAGESSERLNLVPLVDILTSIVFYALLTAATAGASLLAFNVSDTTLAQNEVSSGTAAAAERAPVTVTVRNDRTVIARGDGAADILLAQPAGLDRAALDRIEGALAGLHRGGAAVVVPGDDVTYEHVVNVLERARKANFDAVSLGTLARKG